MTCLLCAFEKCKVIPITEKKILKTYFQCDQCQLIFLNPADRLSAEKENQRYLRHQNKVTDSGYQEFVKPLFEAVVKTFSQTCRGLDFGSGPDSAISYLLLNANYSLEKYDPFFHPDKNVLKPNTYDFIIICEVAEHFYQPLNEFQKLKTYLKAGGSVLIMTSLWKQQTNFKNWSYRRDSTHVCFYSKETFHWIGQAIGFSRVQILKDQIIILESGSVT